MCLRLRFMYFDHYPVSSDSEEEEKKKRKKEKTEKNEKNTKPTPFYNKSSKKTCLKVLFFDFTPVTCIVLSLNTIKCSA